MRARPFATAPMLRVAHERARRRLSPRRPACAMVLAALSLAGPCCRLRWITRSTLILHNQTPAPNRALRRRGLTSLPHRSLPRVAQKLRSAARDLPKPAFPELYPRRAGIAPDFNSGENGPPSQFLAATGAPAALNPVASSQEYHESSRRILMPGPPLQQPPPRAPPATRRRSTTPTPFTASLLEPEPR